MAKCLGCHINFVLLHNKVPQTYSVKQHKCISSQSCRSELWHDIAACFAWNGRGPNLEVSHAELLSGGFEEKFISKLILFVGRIEFLSFCRTEILISLLAITGDCSQLLKAAHTLCHVTPSFFKSVMGIKFFSCFESLTPLSLQVAKKTLLLNSICD